MFVGKIVKDTLTFLLKLVETGFDLSISKCILNVSCIVVSFVFQYIVMTKSDILV
jgi:hypothetical protein